MNCILPSPSTGSGCTSYLCEHQKPISLHLGTWETQRKPRGLLLHQLLLISLTSFLSGTWPFPLLSFKLSSPSIFISVLLYPTFEYLCNWRDRGCIRFICRAAGNSILYPKSTEHILACNSRHIPPNDFHKTVLSLAGYRWKSKGQRVSVIFPMLQC